jgi:hypothetical protein
MLLTVSLVTITAGVAVQQIGPTLHSSAGRAATQQVASVLRLTRMRAIAQNARFRVTFNTTDAKFSVDRETTPGNFVVDEGPFELPGAAAITQVTPSDPIFDSRGALVSPTTVTIQAPHGGAHTISTNLLGRVTVS